MNTFIETRIKLLKTISLIGCALLVFSAGQTLAFSKEGKTNETEIKNAIDSHEKKIAGIEQRLDIRIDGLKESINNTKDSIEHSQKIIDWWIGFLSIFIAIIGVGIPFLVVRNVKRDYEAAVQDAVQAAKSAAETAATIKNFSSQAEADTESIRKNSELVDALVKTNSVIQTRVDQPAPPSPTQEQLKAITETISNPHAPFIDKLKAIALELQREKKWLNAAAIWESLSTLDPTNTSYLLNNADALERAAKDFPNMGKDLLRKAIEKMKIFTDFEKDNSNGFVNLGNKYGYLSESVKEKEERIFLLNESIKQYERALQLQPNSVYAYFNWGTSLSALSDLITEKEEKIRLINEAQKNYETALSIDPKYEPAYSGLAILSGKLSTCFDSVEDKKRLLQESIDICEQSLGTAKSEKTINNILGTCGISLMRLANITEGTDEKKALIERAIEKYKRATTINSDELSNYESWIESINKLIKLSTSDAQKDKLELEKKSILQVSENIKNKIPKV